MSAPAQNCTPERLATVADGLRALVAPGTIFEVRALRVQRNGYGFPSTWSGYFDNPDAAARAITEIDGNATGIYVTMNQPKPELLARASNRIREIRSGEPTTADPDILRRTRLLVDVDPVRPSGISASDVEHRLAIDRAHGVRDELAKLGAPEPLVQDSGNGAQLVYAIDLPADDGGLVKRVLAGLAFRFDDDAVRVDVGNFNPARICKIAGTVARKGDDTQDRPHRRAAIIEAPPSLLPVERELLEVIASWAPAPAVPRHASTTVRSGEALDLMAWLGQQGIETRKPREWNGGTIVKIPCPMNPDHGFDAWAGQDGAGRLSSACFHATCSLRTWRDLRDRYEPTAEARKRTATPAANAKPRSVAPSSRSPEEKAVKERIDALVKKHGGVPRAEETPAVTPSAAELEDSGTRETPRETDTTGPVPAVCDTPVTDEPTTSATVTDPAEDFYPSERPEIVDRKDPEVFREAEAALLAWPESGVFSRGSLLVKIVRTGEPTFGPRKSKAVHRPANAPAIAPVDPVFLCSRMGRAARWVRFVSSKRGSDAALNGDATVKVEADPPMRIARELAAENLLRFPVLEGIAEAPVFLPSGDVLERPGYDRETGLWYAPAADYPPVPSRPDRAEALRSAIEILEPFGEFPFVEDVDRAAFLAYVLTLLARTAIDEPAPMTSFDSPVRGSGKSKLATAGGTIGTGREPALMVPTDDEEELRKAALAFGLEGTRLCIIDNAAGAFGSKQLAAILTMRTISGRVLGLSKTATVPLRVVWGITGNNVTFKGDLARRVMHVRIDPKMEHPENRKDFRIPNLSAYVRDERARLVVAGLTILRAFHLAGRPHNGRPGRGFEAWCALVRSAVEWTIKTDPWPESPDGGDENDTEHEDLRHALLAWDDTFGTLPTTAAAACVRAAGNPDLQATLARFVGVPVARLDARGLGYRLRDRVGQIADGRRFVRDGEDRIAGTKWAVRTTEAES